MASNAGNEAAQGQPTSITYVEMVSPAALVPSESKDPRFQVREATTKEWRFNRFLYQLVGEDWTWIDKLPWTPDQWRAYAEAEDLRTFVGYVDGSIAGYYELHTGENRDVEIAIFGIAPKFVGRGYGGALLTHAIRQAWATGTSRVWLHTCTLDHPGALPNYLKRGFTIYSVESNPRA